MSRIRTAVFHATAVTALALCMPGAAVAAPPANDDFANAEVITGLPAEVTGSDADATTEPDEPISGARSVWFRWTAPAAAGVTLLLDGCAAPFQDSVQGTHSVEVFKKSPVFGLIRLQQPFRAEAGEAYWIVVASEATEPVDPDICLRLVSGPVNDDFARAKPLVGFPVSLSERRSSNEGGASTEPGEPNHAGFDPPASSLWYSWRAPASAPVIMRVCGEATLAVYTGDRVGALTHVATRRPREARCGDDAGASMVVDAREGEDYRVAVVAPPERFRLLVGSQATLLRRAGRAWFWFSAFPGMADDVEVRLTGTGAQRALLLRADGVTAANGCQADTTPGRLRCPAPGKGMVAMDLELGDRNDTADITLLERANAGAAVSGGDGDDNLTGTGSLYGGRGADHLTGGSGADWLSGGPGPDRLDARGGVDTVVGGAGDDHLRASDNENDSVNCAAGRDRARLDGIDVSQGCERRDLTSPARAVATWAVLSNDDADDYEHLELGIACPIDVREGCRTKVTVAGKRGHSVVRRLRLAAGRSRVVNVYTLGALGPILKRGVRVTVATRRRGRAALRYTHRLVVADERYFGEG